MIGIKCKNCKKIFYTYDCMHRKYCSPECDREYRKKNGLTKIYSQRRKDSIINQLKDIKQLSDKKVSYNKLTTAEKKTYHDLHTLIRGIKKRPLLCQKCNKSKPTNLANISGQYKNDIKDYLWVCRRCHNQMDKLVNNFKQAYKMTKRNKYGRWGDEKSLGEIICKNCKQLCDKQNPNQKYCEECTNKLNTRH